MDICASQELQRCVAILWNKTHVRIKVIVCKALWKRISLSALMKNLLKPLSLHG